MLESTAGGAGSYWSKFHCAGLKLEEGEVRVWGSPLPISVHVCCTWSHPGTFSVFPSTAMQHGVRRSPPVRRGSTQAHVQKLPSAGKGLGPPPPGAPLGSVPRGARVPPGAVGEVLSWVTPWVPFSCGGRRPWARLMTPLATHWGQGLSVLYGLVLLAGRGQDATSWGAPFPTFFQVALEPSPPWGSGPPAPRLPARIFFMQPRCVGHFLTSVLVPVPDAWRPCPSLGRTCSLPSRC